MKQRPNKSFRCNVDYRLTELFRDDMSHHQNKTVRDDEFHHLSRSFRIAICVAIACLTLAGLLVLPSCVSVQSGQQSSQSTDSSEVDAIPSKSEASSSVQRKRVYVPLTWDVNSAYLVGRQGSTYLWGTCGQCVIADTLNLVTGSSHTEADIVNFTVENELCDPSTGGMTLQNMADAYAHLLDRSVMDAYGYGGDYAPSIEEMADLLDNGIILSVSVYGEMMREGGHTGEGEIEGTHWILVHSAQRAANGDVEGFGIIDPATSISYLSASDLSDIYYGHDGTIITDPSVVEVYGWKYADEE